MGIYLICFGESESNLEIALKEKVIGIFQKRSFNINDKAYLIIKREKKWYVIARCCIGKPADFNPFEQPNKYITYTISNVERAKPYDISGVLQESFGSTYGLVLRAPNLITASSFINKIDQLFLSKE